MENEYRHIDDIDDSEFEELILPAGRKPGSLSDIQYIYGKIAELGYESTEYIAPKEYRPFLTPMKASEVINQEQGVIYLDVVLSRAKRSIIPVGSTVTTGSKEHIDRCAYSKYQAKRGTDHSISQLTSKTSGISTEKSSYRDFTYITDNMLDMVTRRWADGEHIKEARDKHKDGWIIDEIGSLHESERMENIKKELKEKLNENDTKNITRIVSIRFYESDEAVDTLNLPGDTDHETWTYPVEVDVLLEAVKSRQEGKYRTKNSSNAKGTSAGYVESETVQPVCGMGEHPLSLYTGKKRAWMPHLNRDLSTATHPYTAKTLCTISRSESLLEVCTQTAGLSIYHLPYFGGEQTVTKMKALYGLLWDTYTRANQREDQDDNKNLDRIQQFYKRIQEDVDANVVPQEIAKSLKFWTVSIVNYQADRKRAINEVKGGNVLSYVDTAKHATNVARDLSATNLFKTYNWDFATPETNFLTQITSPYWFINTTVTTTDEDDVDANEPGYALYNKLLRNEPIRLSQLLDAYVDHIEQKYDASEDDGRRVPTLQIIQQLAQLTTLCRSGLLEPDIPEVADNSETYSIPTTEDINEVDKTNTMTNTTGDSTDSDDEGKITSKQRAIAAKEAYEKMISEQAVLSESPSRRAVFTLGSLITTVSGHQASKGTETLNSRLSPTTITKHNVEDYVTEVLNLINTYATAENGSNVWKYETQTTQLTKDLTEKPVDEWKLSSSDIQYHISLGMAFGAQIHS